MMRKQSVLTLIGVVVVLPLLGLSGTSAASATTGQRARAAAPAPCSLAALRIGASWKAVNKNMPGGGAAVGTVSFKLRKGATCTLSGWPALRLRNAQNSLLPVGQQNVGDKSATQPIVKLTASVAGHSQYGVAQVMWLNWCKGKVPLPIKMAVSLPKGTASTIVPIKPGGRVLASCVNPTASSVLQVTSVQQAGR